MNVNKKYIIKCAESTHYCSGIRKFSPHLKDALLFELESHAVAYIINDKVTLDKGESFLIIPVYNTI